MPRDASTSAALELASAVQSGSIKAHPTARDLAPSSVLDSVLAAVDSAADSDSDPLDLAGSGSGPLGPAARARRPLPPLPDMRFEQSYLASVRGAGSARAVAWITLRDQVLAPLLQGALYSLALLGWRHWSAGAGGAGAGAAGRLRRWWWRVNGWDARTGRDARAAGRRLAGSVGEVSASRLETALTSQFYEFKAAAGGD
jgi:hypothetical protein